MSFPIDRKLDFFYQDAWMLARCAPIEDKENMCDYLVTMDTKEEVSLTDEEGKIKTGQEWSKDVTWHQTPFFAIGGSVAFFTGMMMASVPVGSVLGTAAVILSTSAATGGAASLISDAKTQKDISTRMIKIVDEINSDRTTRVSEKIRLLQNQLFTFERDEGNPREIDQLDCVKTYFIARLDHFNNNQHVDVRRI